MKCSLQFFLTVILVTILNFPSLILASGLTTDSLTNQDGGGGNNNSGSYRDNSNNLNSGSTGGQVVEASSNRVSSGSLVYSFGGNHPQLSLAPINNVTGPAQAKKPVLRKCGGQSEIDDCICNMMNASSLNKYAYAKIVCSQASNTRDTLNQAAAQQKQASTPAQRVPCSENTKVTVGTQNAYLKACQ